MAERIAFRMTLHPGQAAEYKRRHDAIFPDLRQALKDAGVSDYSIWHDPQSDHLFAILTRSDDHRMDDLPQLDIVKRWWAHMADIMATDAENVPDQVPLTCLFLLP
jgi:L-rhamnose mutarotase